MDDAERAVAGSRHDGIEATAHRLADIARTETLRHFRGGALAISDKGGTASRPDFDPVTEADRAAETAMRAHLAQVRPGDGILGEEFGATPSRSGLTWVLDPVDGTRGFVCGTPTWGVLIAVQEQGQPIYGVIDQPFIGERFEGGLGRARTIGPMGTIQLGTRAARPLAEASLLTTFPEVGAPEERAAFLRVAERARLVRYGLDCYGYALLALGQVDLVIEAGLAPYDIQAPIAVVEAAGGIVTDWEGGSAAQGGKAIAAANAQIHREALDLLNRAGV